jgi:hypothetical protein
MELAAGCLATRSMREFLRLFRKNPAACIFAVALEF